MPRKFGKKIAKYDLFFYCTVGYVGNFSLALHGKRLRN